MGGLKIVVISTDPPDPFGTAAGRWYYVMAKGLCDRGHQVKWFAAYDRESSAARARASLSHTNVQLGLYSYPRDLWPVRKWQTLRRPYSYFFSKRMVNDVKSEIGYGYDVVHMEQTWSAWLGRNTPRSVLSVHWLACVDLDPGEHDPIGSLPATRAALMTRTERHLLREVDTIRVLTSEDAHIIRGMLPNGKIAAIPLAIDSSLYQFEVAEPPVPTVGLIGSMNWHPTRAAAIRLITRVWPRVKECVGHAQLLIAGWAARRALAPYLELPGVTIVEDVPDIATCFHQLSVLAFPAGRSSGMKVKVLEAMAYGVPVVTTAHGMAGIDAQDDIHALIADDDTVFAHKLIGLLSDKSQRRKVAYKARMLIEETYSGRQVLAQLESLYECILS